MAASRPCMFFHWHQQSNHTLVKRLVHQGVELIQLEWAGLGSRFAVAGTLGFEKQAHSLAVQLHVKTEGLSAQVLTDHCWMGDLVGVLTACCAGWDRPGQAVMHSDVEE